MHGRRCHYILILNFWNVCINWSLKYLLSTSEAGYAQTMVCWLWGALHLLERVWSFNKDMKWRRLIKEQLKVHSPAEDQEQSSLHLLHVNDWRHVCKFCTKVLVSSWVREHWELLSTTDRKHLVACRSPPSTEAPGLLSLFKDSDRQHRDYSQPLILSRQQPTDTSS